MRVGGWTPGKEWAKPHHTHEGDRAVDAVAAKTQTRYPDIEASLRAFSHEGSDSRRLRFDTIATSTSTRYEPHVAISTSGAVSRPHGSRSLQSTTMPTSSDANATEAAPSAAVDESQADEGATVNDCESEAAHDERVVPLVYLDKPPLDPRVLRNVIDSYEGETTQVLQCDLPVYHGHGKAVFKTGFAYEGAFYYGRMHGHGRIEWTSGVVYEGTLVDNEIQGRGSYWWPNGSSYTGDVVRGKRHGHGVFHTGTRGSVALPGDDASPDGAGAHDSAQLHSQPMFPLHFSFHDSETPDNINTVSCARYEGQWVDGLPHGRGVLVFDDDQLVRYEGDFVVGKRHGKGEMRYASGNVYVGDWVDDVKCGHGTMLWMAPNGGSAVEKYDGAWRDDRPQGHGRHVWLASASVTMRQREKNWYEGQFHEGVRHGLGAFFYANGARYEGEWVDNVKHGRGVFYFEDGRVFLGEFRDDRAVESTNASIGAGGGADPIASGTAAATSANKIVLYVDDLLPSPPARDKARKLIEHAVLRINTELRALYRQYLPQPLVGSPNSRMSVSPVHHKASDGGDTTGLEGATLMEYYECRRLFADGGVRLSGGQLDLLLQQIRHAQRRATIPRELEDTPAVPEVPLTDPVTLAASMPEVLPPVRLLLFREFVELLVRLAHHQAHPTDPDADGDVSAVPGPSVAETFVAFYEQLTRDRQRMGKNFEPVTTPLHQLYAKELHSVYQKHHGALQKLFVACRRRTKPTKAEEPEETNEDEDLHQSPEAVKIKEILVLLQDQALVISPSFRIRHAIDALETVFASEEDKGVDPFFVDTALVFTDFLDALAVLLLAKQSQDAVQQDPPSTAVPLFALVDELAHAIPVDM